MDRRASLHRPAPRHRGASLRSRHDLRAHHGIRRLAILLAALLSALLALAAASAAATAAPLSMSRAEIIARAESAIGSNYTWGRESWVPNATGAGPDCSGYVLKCWEAPRSLLYQEEDGLNATISPRYTTYHFYNNVGPWASLTDRGALQPGDALVRYDGSSGHVVLYAEGDAWGYPVVYEAPYTGAVIRRAQRYLDGTYRPKRRDSLTGSSIMLDNPTTKSTGGDDVGGTWTRSTSVSGYVGVDYQVRAATSSTAWSRWTPRLPISGYYDVYLRWTMHPNRATKAKVTINTPNGQLIKYIDQTKNGGIWVRLGRYGFNAGYSTGSGSVAVHATGANGYVVADGAYFVPVG